MAAQDATARAQGTRPKVIYVIGAGRSGSTILGVALGNCAGVFYAGELDAWLRSSGVSPRAGSEHARFWQAVGGEVAAGDLFGDQAWRHLEHSLAPFRIRSWQTRRRLRVRYREVAERLYRAIAHTADASCVVDTSHYPLRAKELQRIDGIDLYLLYLVRNPHDVVTSFKRRDADASHKSPLATNVYLWLTHLLSAIVFLRHPPRKRMFVSYDDFTAAPQATLRRLLDGVGIDAPVPDASQLQPGLAFQGNRLLQQDVLTIVAQTRRRPTLRTTSLIQAPWTLWHRSLRRSTPP